MLQGGGSPLMSPAAKRSSRDVAPEWDAVHMTPVHNRGGSGSGFEKPRHTPLGGGLSPVAHFPAGLSAVRVVTPAAAGSPWFTPPPATAGMSGFGASVPGASGAGAAAQQPVPFVVPSSPPRGAGATPTAFSASPGGGAAGPGVSSTEQRVRMEAGAWGRAGGGAFAGPSGGDSSGGAGGAWEGARTSKASPLSHAALHAKVEGILSSWGPSTRVAAATGESALVCAGGESRPCVRVRAFAARHTFQTLAVQRLVAGGGGGGGGGGARVLT
jgi:hypothetical protein